MAALATQNAIAQNTGLATSNAELSQSNLPPSPENHDSLLAGLNTNHNLGKAVELANRFPLVEFTSIENGANNVALVHGDKDFLKVSSEILEILMENLPGDLRRSLERALREATALAGTNPKEQLNYLSRYNFLAYHLGRASEVVAQPLALAA